MRTKRLLLSFGALLCLAVSLLFAVDVAGIFELDGNAADDPAVAGEDWQTVNAASYSGSAIVRTGVIPDMHTGSPFDPTIFGSNQTKDTVDIPGNWTWKSGSVPDKNDLDNVYAAAYVPPSGADAGHLIFVFGADRFSAGNGDAFLGFWFFQSRVEPGPGGAFTGQHTPGDILVLVNFTGGGGTPNVQVLKWVASGGDVATNLLQVFQGAAECMPGHVGPACAKTNATSAIDVYWPFEYKGAGLCSGPVCSVPPLAFFEGAVDLTELFGDNLPCITGFLAETRSSSSVTADLKDFVTHAFELCKVGITKACATQVPQGNTIQYTNTITVQNLGAGKLFNALVTDTFQTGVGTTGTQYFAADCTGLSSCTTVPALAEIPPSGAPGSSVAITETYNSSLLTATNNATVEAAPLPGAPRTVKPDPLYASATCTTPITSDVEVIKNCNAVELVPVGGALQVKVTVSGTIKNISQSNTNIVIDSLTNNPSVGSLTPAKSTLAQNEQTTFGPFSYFPSAVSLTQCATGQTCFTDVVTATWHAVLGGQTGSSSGTANCPLCPAQGSAGCPAGQSCKP